MRDVDDSSSTTVWIESNHLEEAFRKREAPTLELADSPEGKKQDNVSRDSVSPLKRYTYNAANKKNFASPTNRSLGQSSFSSPNLVKRYASNSNTNNPFSRLTPATKDDWGWVRAVVVLESETGGNTKTIRIDDEDSSRTGETIEISIKEGAILSANEWEEVDRNIKGLPPNDLINLTHLHEATLVFCLRRRYEVDKIYTNTGRILLALNPFKRLNLYSEESMQLYLAHNIGLAGNSGGDEDSTIPPHCYQVAGRAYSSMQRALEILKFSRGISTLENTADQSILVSGESGAGKTVTTKFVMAYLAYLSEKNKGCTSSEAKGGIEDQVLKSNPILESFGNARTTRNDNSSRFGKFIKIQFSKSGYLMGASIDTYLLEKVRIMFQAPGERNYHIFYEILQGASIEERKQHFLDGLTAEDFKMTSSGTYGRRDGIKDHQTYADLRSAMDTLGFSETSQEGILSLVCALLHASNLTLRAVSADESELKDDNSFLDHALELLGVTREALNYALCKFSISAGKDTYVRSLPKHKAERGLEAFIRGTYAALFNYLVHQVNLKIKQGVTNVRHSFMGGSAATIGLLDIFGFESFKKNSFEQLCINYCNEALQQQFNQYVLKTEQEIYKQEGIKWSFITFPDNQDVLDLIDKKGSGILPILDDQVRTVGGTDKSFSNDLYRKCTDHPRFSASKLQVGSRKFELNHYAGAVVYETDGLVEKNKDEFPREASDLLESSTKALIKDLGVMISTSSATTLSSRERKSQRTTTVSGQFVTQLRTLRERIMSTSPHYIRCIKPNHQLAPDSFDPGSTVEQLRCAGVLEAVRVARAGFPQRFSHAGFITQYGSLAAREADNIAGNIPSARDLCVTIVGHVSKKMWEIENDYETPFASCDPTNFSGIQVGLTRVFLCNSAFEFLERTRVEVLNRASVVIQAHGRRFIAKKYYVNTLTLIVVVQCAIRRYLAYKSVNEIRRNSAASKIQKYARRRGARIAYIKVKYVVLWCQHMYRGRVDRLIFQETLAAYNAAIMIQCMVRLNKARSIIKELRTEQRNLGYVEGERDRYKREAELMKQQLSEARLRGEEEIRLSKLKAAEELEVMKRQAEEEAKMRAADEFMNSSVNSSITSVHDDVENLRAEVESWRTGRIVFDAQSVSSQTTDFQGDFAKLQLERDEALEEVKSANDKHLSALREIEMLRNELKSRKHLPVILERNSTRTAAPPKKTSYCAIFRFFQSSTPVNISTSIHYN